MAAVAGGLDYQVRPITLPGSNRGTYRVHRRGKNSLNDYRLEAGRLIYDRKSACG
jgi:hypothetical protein